MNKKISTPIAIGITLVLAVIIGGYTLWQFSGIQKNQVQLLEEKFSAKEEEISFKEAIKECENFMSGSPLATEELENGQKHLEDYLNSVCIKPLCDSFKTAEEKIQICTREENVSERDLCFLSIFPQTVEACDNVSDSSYGRDSCYRSVAEKNGDDSSCSKINDDWQRAKCYQIIGEIKKDPKICQKINYDANKNSCLGIALNDISKCGDEEGGDEKYHCYAEVAKSKNDLSICEKIIAPSDEYDYGYRKDYCILGVAKLRKDSSLCDKINDLDYKSSCYLDITDKIDIDFCYKKSISIDACYAKLALQEKDFSLCSKIISFPEICSISFMNLTKEQAVKLNKNLDEEDQSLYNQYCKEGKKMTISVPEIKWESHQDSSMGFSVNYPNNWKWRDPIEYKKDEGVKATRLERVSRYFTCKIDLVRAVIRDKKGEEVPFEEFINGSKEAIIKLGKDNNEKIEVKEDNVIIENIPAVKLSYFIPPELSGMEKGEQIFSIFIPLEKKETFSITYYEKKGDYECESIFSQIISTFKFIESLPIEIRNNENFIEWLKSWQISNPSLAIYDFSRENSSEFLSSIKWTSDEQKIRANCLSEHFTEEREFYSPDKTKSIYFPCSLGEPDLDVWLYNRNNDGKMELISSTGPSLGYDGAFWINNNRFIILEYFWEADGKISLYVTDWDLINKTRIDYKSSGLNPKQL